MSLSRLFIVLVVGFVIIDRGRDGSRSPFLGVGCPTSGSGPCPTPDPVPTSTAPSCDRGETGEDRSAISRSSSSPPVGPGADRTPDSDEPGIAIVYQASSCPGP